MVEFLLSKYSNKFVSRRLIFIIDLAAVACSFVVACLLRFNLNPDNINWQVYQYYLFTLLFFRFVCIWSFKSYRGIVRHTSVEDASLILKAITTSSILTLVFSLALTHTTNNELFYIPISILLIEYFISLFFMIASRFLVKNIYKTLIANAPGETVNVLIYGAGGMGVLTKNALIRNLQKKYNILGFIDDNPTLIYKTVEGIKVYSEDDAIARFILNQSTDNIEVILAIQNIRTQRKNNIIEAFLKYDIVVKITPSVYEGLKNAEIKTEEIRKIKIEDLLERDPIQLDNQNISEQVTNKVILITGAAGSIGSEIVRQVLRFNPHTLVLLDQAESGLYDLMTELNQAFAKYLVNVKIVSQVANVTDEIRLRQIFEVYSPSIVFHAAAYKHVPLMEEQPYEAVKVNVFGTKIVADLAVEYSVQKFVMISTDKAVNPTNVMGATKRLAEMYVHSLNERFTSSTRFITTRFGNVLGSNGSVVPLFQKQIQSGGPITVTHPDVIRYFMTIPEACQLVLEAGTMGKGGEVFVFDMGEPVKIADLAQKMIKLSGLRLDKDVSIIYTGLRPGEKLYEELLGDKEKTLPTYNPKIQIAQVNSEPFADLVVSLQELRSLLRNSDKTAIVGQMKLIVPEFISNNSEFEHLDEFNLLMKHN
jgi:FlaA1/EpsC-like NDP-sugar epimerase